MQCPNPRFIAAAFFLSGVSFVVPSARADYTTGLVARYNFEEGSGTTANDTGNTPGGHTGTLASTNTPTYVSGNVGSDALQFNGASTGVTVPHSADFAALNSYTVSAWFNLANLGALNSQQCLFSTRGGTDYTLDFKVGNATTNNVIHGDIGNGSGGWLSTVADNNSVRIGANQWYLLTYTVTSGTATIYINDGTSNTYQGSTTTIALSAGAPDLEGASSYITIGSQNGGENFNGKIDDVRIYNAALTQAQVAQVYSSGLVPEPASFGLLGLGCAGLLFRRRRVM